MHFDKIIDILYYGLQTLHGGPQFRCLWFYLFLTRPDLVLLKPSVIIHYVLKKTELFCDLFFKNSKLIYHFGKGCNLKFTHDFTNKSRSGEWVKI